MAKKSVPPPPPPPRWVFGSPRVFSPTSKKKLKGPTKKKMDGNDEGDDDDAASLRRGVENKEGEDDKNETLKKWRQSSLFPEETRARRWASKLTLTVAAPSTSSSSTNSAKNNARYRQLLEQTRLEPTKTTLETLSQIEKDLPRSGSTYESSSFHRALLRRKRTRFIIIIIFFFFTSSFHSFRVTLRLVSLALRVDQARDFQMEQQQHPQQRLREEQRRRRRFFVRRREQK